jgi:small-conductance mechanosensitive channel
MKPGFIDFCRSVTLSLALTLTLGGSAQMFGQKADDASGTSEVVLAPVVIDGETLFSVRGVTAHPAKLRAGQIEDRIRAIAADSAIQAGTLMLEADQGATWIVAGSQRIMAVLDEDAAVEDLARATLASIYRARIVNSIEAYRRDRRPGRLLLDALYALGITIALIVATILGRRIVVRLRAHLERRYRSQIEDIGTRAHNLIKGERVWGALTGLLNLVWGVVLAVMVYLYLSHVFSLFPSTRGFAKSLFAIAIDPLQIMGRGLIGMIPQLVFLVILAVVTRYGLKLSRIVFDEIAAGRLTFEGFDPEWAHPTYRLVRLTVISFAVVVAYPHIPGSGSEAFKGVSLFVGLVFSLGSSSFIGNMIAGFSMTYRRAFRTGDLVKTGDQMGRVEQVRLMVTHLRTVKNEEVILPNSLILNAEVVNYSSLARQRGLILHTTVGIGYETPWRQVEAMLLEAAAHTSGLCVEPAPFVLAKELGDFSVTYELNVFCDTPEFMQKLYGELHKNILDVFNAYGVQIMTPAYEGDPDQPKIVPREQWYTVPAHAPEVTATDASNTATKVTLGSPRSDESLRNSNASY